jgi:hypothetical protein
MLNNERNRFVQFRQKNGCNSFLQIYLTESNDGQTMHIMSSAIVCLTVNNGGAIALCFAY